MSHFYLTQKFILFQESLKEKIRAHAVGQFKEALIPPPIKKIRDFYNKKVKPYTAAIPADVKEELKERVKDKIYERIFNREPR